MKGKSLLAELVRFGLVGIAATLLDMGLFWILSDICNVYYIIASIISFSVSVIFNYLFSKIWVFRVNSTHNVLREFLQFLFSAVIGLGINTAVLWLCVDLLFPHIGILNPLSDNLKELGGKVIATVIVMIWNYLIRKFWIFKKEPDSLETSE